MLALRALLIRNTWVSEVAGLGLIVAGRFRLRGFLVRDALEGSADVLKVLAVWALVRHWGRNSVSGILLRLVCNALESAVDVFKVLAGGALGRHWGRSLCSSDACACNHAGGEGGGGDSRSELLHENLSRSQTVRDQ